MADAGDALWFGGFRGLRDSVNQGAGKRFFFFFFQGLFIVSDTGVRI